MPTAAPARQTTADPASVDGSAAHQPSFEDLGEPLVDTTFVVLDLETTGLSPADDRITEVGAVKIRGGRVLGELQTLVHPGRPIPAAVTAVTGITDTMVADQPQITAVLPMLLAFCRGSVLVAHNASFDTRFLNAALTRHGYDRLDHPVVDTVAVARRVLDDEVRNVRLGTLAGHLGADTEPEHRALSDARATVDVLHRLLERIGNLGATTLEDLRDYTRSSSDRAFRKVALVRDAPAAPGVYRFLGDDGEVLYVGKSVNLRRRLRSYFGQDRRRRIADLVRETTEVRWTATTTALEAAVCELRAIHAHRPRYNRRSTHPERRVWIRLTIDEAFPRLSIARKPRDDEAAQLGPVRSRAAAEQFVEAAEQAFRLRACRFRIRRAQDHDSCLLKDLGRCGAPCDGSQGRAEYLALVDRYRRAVTGDPAGLLDPLRDRMAELAAAGRYERAGEVRDRLHAAARVLHRGRRRGWLRGMDRLAAARPGPDDGTTAVLIERGRLTAAAALPGGTAPAVLPALERRAADRPLPRPPGPWATEELDLLTDWLAAPEVVVVRAEGRAALPVRGGRLLAETVDEQRRVTRAERRDRQAWRREKVARRAS